MERNASYATTDEPASGCLVGMAGTPADRTPFGLAESYNADASAHDPPTFRGEDLADESTGKNERDRR